VHRSSRSRVSSEAVPGEGHSPSRSRQPATCRGHRPGSRRIAAGRAGAAQAQDRDDERKRRAVEIDFDTENGLLCGIPTHLCSRRNRSWRWRAATDGDGLKLAEPGTETARTVANVGLDHLTRSVDRVRTKNASDGTNMAVRARYVGRDPKRS
jgi:hypothetical protein